MQRLIGITGAAGSGKTHAAGLLYKAVPQQGTGDLVLRGFADPLKQAANALLFWGGAHKEGFKIATVLPGVTGRRVLEAVGTDAMRELCPDWAVIHMRARLTEVESDAWVVIPDVRFANEAEFIRGRSGVVVETCREPEPGCNGGDPQHASQQPLPASLVDYWLDNSGDDARTVQEWRIILRDRGWL